MNCNRSDSVLIKTEKCESISVQHDPLGNDNTNEENRDIQFIKVENCDDNFRIDYFFEEVADAEECEIKFSYKQFCRDEAVRCANEEELSETDPLCITNEPDRKNTTSSDSFVEVDEDDSKVRKFWSEHKCSQNCNKLFTMDDLRTFRRESQTLDYTDKGVNRLDVIILSVIRVLWCKKNGEESNPDKRKDYNCDFKLLGETVCRDFFLFAHAIRLRRWESLLEMYKEDGFLEKRRNPLIPKSRRITKKKIAK